MYKELCMYLRAYRKSIWYLIRHKYHVGRHLLAYGLIWRAFSHDLSKFLPSELFPYAEKYFLEKNVHNEKQFKLAVQKHYYRNSHHPEYHDMHRTVMSKNDCIEMVCDWIGVGYSKKGYDDAQNFYAKVRENLPEYIQHNVDMIMALRYNPHAKILGLRNDNQHE